jgi:hypothetical protein
LTTLRVVKKNKGPFRYLGLRRSSLSQATQVQSLRDKPRHSKI